MSTRSAAIPVAERIRAIQRKSAEAVSTESASNEPRRPAPRASAWAAEFNGGSASSEPCGDDAFPADDPSLVALMRRPLPPTPQSTRLPPAPPDAAPPDAERMAGKPEPGGEPALLFEEGWVWKKGKGHSDLGHFKIGRRNWAKRYLVLGHSWLEAFQFSDTPAAPRYRRIRSRRHTSYVLLTSRPPQHNHHRSVALAMPQ